MIDAAFGSIGTHALKCWALVACFRSRYGAILVDLDDVLASDQGPFKPSDELRLMQRAVEDAYPRLPSDLQDIARRIVFVVSHDPAWTRLVFGWGPEDDPD